MQSSVCSTPPPSARPEFLRTRRAVTREAKGLESVQQLAIASEAGWRTPWTLPPIGKRWREPVSARLMLLYLGWLLEGSVRPTWAKGGLIVMDGVTRTLLGSIEDRDHLTDELVPGDWARLLRCSAKQARRCIHLAARLGLVEQIRNREPHLRAKCEQPAAYLPTVKLLEWLRDRKPASDLFDLPETDKMSDPQKSTETSDGQVDLLRPEGLHEVRQEGRAPDAVAASEAPSPEASPAPSERTAEGLGGSDRGGRAGGAVAKVLQFAARPEPEPSSSAPTPEELEAFSRAMVRRIQSTPGIASLPSGDDERSRRAQLAAQLAALERRRRGDDPAGGAS